MSAEDPAIPDSSMNLAGLHQILLQEVSWLLSFVDGEMDLGEKKLKDQCCLAEIHI